MVTTVDKAGVDRAGFETWVTPRLPGLLRFAYLVTGSRDAAQDAVQGALAAAYETWDHVSTRAQPDQYVRRMIANSHVSQWRRIGRREFSVAEPRGGSAADSTEQIAEHDAVWRMCVGLPPQQRAAVVLRFYEDLDYREIARVLAISEATARSHIHRALITLRIQLTSEDLP